MERASEGEDQGRGEKVRKRRVTEKGSGPRRRDDALFLDQPRVVNHQVYFSLRILQRKDSAFEFGTIQGWGARTQGVGFRFQG